MKGYCSDAKKLLCECSPESNKSLRSKPRCLSEQFQLGDSDILYFSWAGGAGRVTNSSARTQKSTHQYLFACSMDLGVARIAREQADRDAGRLERANFRASTALQSAAVASASLLEARTELQEAREEAATLRAALSATQRKLDDSAAVATSQPPAVVSMRRARGKHRKKNTDPEQNESIHAPSQSPPPPLAQHHAMTPSTRCPPPSTVHHSSDVLPEAISEGRVRATVIKANAERDLALTAAVAARAESLRLARALAASDEALGAAEAGWAKAREEAVTATRQASAAMARGVALASRQASRQSAHVSATLDHTVRVARNEPPSGETAALRSRLVELEVLVTAMRAALVRALNIDADGGRSC